MALQALDMSSFFGTPEQRQDFSTTLLNILKSRGVAKVRNHGIPDSTIDKLFELTAQFFALSHEEKMYAKHPPQSNPNRGYSYVGQENIASISGYERTASYGRNVKDVKETFDLGSKDDTIAANRWPRDAALPEFRPFMESFYTIAFQTELHILSALAQALGISAPHLKELHSRAENEFRLLHYPTTLVSVFRDKSSTRIAEHTDFGTITLLFQDSTGGLQVEDQERPGIFHDVEPNSRYEIILNIGDSLQRLTNDTFRAACHRVTLPPTVQIDGENEEMLPERYSVAYFAKVNRDASLLPLQRFVTDARPCRYTDITSAEFNDLRIAKLFSGKA